MSADAQRKFCSEGSVHSRIVLYEASEQTAFSSKDERGPGELWGYTKLGASRTAGLGSLKVSYAG